MENTKYIIKKITQEQKLKALENLVLAVVDPNYLKKLSEIVDRELIASKDTEDYNSSIVSGFFDKASISMREAGQISVEPGDVFKINEVAKAFAQNRKPNLENFNDISVVANYHSFPFSIGLSQEMRTHFLLKTSKSDNFDSLIDEVDGLISKYLSINDWIKLKTAIKKAETRLFANKIKVLKAEKILGVEQELSRAEAEDNGIAYNPSLKIDVRSDNHDLLALKELISMLKGENVHHLTIGPGFFAKYIPEIKELGYDGIVFKTEQNKLKEIKLSKNDENMIVDFSPIVAANIVINEYSYSINSKNKKVFHKKDIYTNNSRYYVVVDGCISAPEDKRIVGYEALSKNTIAVKCGEVFLFENLEDKYEICTRLYFVPYDYSDLNLIHHHGSVVFGSNDQSMHSCVANPEEDFDEDTHQYFLAWLGKNFKHMYDSCFVAATYHFLKKGEEPSNLVNDVNTELREKTFGSLFEETDFTIMYLIHEYIADDDLDKAALINMFLKNYAPLTKRFILGKYLIDSNGLMPQRVECTYQVFAKEMESKLLYRRVTAAIKEDNLKKKKDEDN